MIGRLSSANRETDKIKKVINMWKRRCIRFFDNYVLNHLEVARGIQDAVVIDRGSDVIGLAVEKQ
jgi:hypothetical protein